MVEPGQHLGARAPVRDLERDAALDVQQRSNVADGSREFEEFRGRDVDDPYPISTERFVSDLGDAVAAQAQSDLTAAFVDASTRLTFPPLVAAYSALLGVLVPSGGSKWVIEAPYVLQAAHDLKVHLGWTVAVYNLGEALANLVQPFWMLPILGLFGLRARDVMGYTFVVFIVLLPLVLVLVTVLGATLPYPL